jgi:UDP-N-acetylmuramate--alanine ligase
MQMPRDAGTFHIIGIGGIGMSAIAEILMAKGFNVQGSDQKESANVRRLRAKGIRVFVGHDPINLIGAENVVISTAVKDDNVELRAARERGLVIIRRAEMLAELMRLYATVSVTGTHGKTTTSSLLAHVFEASGLDPTVITGGILNAWGTNARLGKGQWMVVEADESDGTFTRLPTEIGIVTNIDPEHLDYFGSVENMHREYAAFLRNIPFYGLAVAFNDHPVVREMIATLQLRTDGRRLLTYGTREGSDLRLVASRADGHHTFFDCDISSRVNGGARRIEGWSIPILGDHNVLNALAAVAVAMDVGIADDTIKASLSSFSGVKRRFQLTGTWQGIAIFDDYAHHPVEIGAVLAAAKGGARGRVMAIVEPHRYTRVRDLFGDFCSCFKSADSVVVLPLYSAGELPIDGIDQYSLADGIRSTGHPATTAVANAEQLVELVQNHARSGDMIVFVGAGQSTEWAHALPQWLQERQPQRAGGAL